MVQNAERAPMTGKSRKQRTEAAIAAALAGDWRRAAAENRALLDQTPRDVEAANRLGKALTQLGQKKQAIEAYRAALALDPSNAIARKNLPRLEDTKAPAKPPRVPRPATPELAKPATSLIEASDRAATTLVRARPLRPVETTEGTVIPVSASSPWATAHASGLDRSGFRKAF